MTVSTSALWDFITALLAKFRADATIATTYNTLVIDGPTLLNEAPPNILFVGGTPGDKDMGLADGSFAQQWGELGARARYEDLSVSCELWCRGGGTDLSVNRATAAAILAAIESALRIDFTLGLAARLMWCEVQGGQLFQGQTQQGSTVRLPFTITARVRLASQ
jgi:hypothetical protein